MGKFVKWIVGVFVVLIVIALINPFATVDAGERGVVLNFGAFNGQILDPGLHLVTPVAQSVIKMDVQTQKLELEGSEAYSHDLQNVRISSVVNYNLDPAQAGIVYQQYGYGYEEKILRPNMEAAIKQTVAKYSAEELLSKRAIVQSEIESTFRASIPPQFIVTKYALVDEAFSEAYERAIEAKQVAQQDAERAQNELKKVQIEAEQRVAQAKAEAEAIKIQAEAIQQQGGASYVQLQAIAKWDGRLPSQMVPGSAVPFIDLTSVTKK